MTLLWIGLAVYVLGSFFDAYTTKRAVHDHPGKYHEGNPVMAGIFRFTGIVPGLILTKCAGGAIFLAIAFTIPGAYFASGGGLLALGLVFGYQGWKNRQLFRR